MRYIASTFWFVVLCIICLPAIACGQAAVCTTNVVPDLAAAVLAPTGFATLIVLEHRRRRFEPIREGISFGYFVAKRVLDIVLASMVLVIAFPLFLLMAIIVRCDSRGPILYSRKVVGKRGQVFGMLKFRTMVDRAEEILDNDAELKKRYAINWKLKHDPRVTRVGKFLRKTSLDELPQFINILLGHMTFVGPRPIACDEVERYGEAVERFKTVTPGITGFWQTSGRSEVSYERRVELDMLYIEKRTLLLDIWIILCTLPAIILKRGAC